MECKICNKLVKSLKGLSLHISQIHKDITPQQYYDLFINKKKNALYVIIKQNL